MIRNLAVFVMKIFALPALIISVRFQIKNIEESMHERLEDTMMLTSVG